MKYTTAHAQMYTFPCPNAHRISQLHDRGAPDRRLSFDNPECETKVLEIPGSNATWLCLRFSKAVSLSLFGMRLGCIKDADKQMSPIRRLERCTSPRSVTRKCTPLERALSCCNIAASLTTRALDNGLVKACTGQAPAAHVHHTVGTNKAS